MLWLIHSYNDYYNIISCYKYNLIFNYDLRYTIEDKCY